MFWQACLQHCGRPYHSLVNVCPDVPPAREVLRTQARGNQFYESHLCLILERGQSMLRLDLVLNIPPKIILWEALLFSLWLHPHQDKDVEKDRDQGQSQGKTWPRGVLPPCYYQSMNELGCCYVTVNPQTQE